MPAHILIADDEEKVRSGLAKICRAAGHLVSTAENGRAALELAQRQEPDVVLLDLEMPEMGGLEALPALVALPAAPSVVIVTGFSDVSTAVQAMREGAADFLEKPARRELVTGVLDRVLRHRAVLRERNGLRRAVSALHSGPMIGHSEAMIRVQEHIARVASTPRTTVLIGGESGVGKELVARAIHDNSARRDGPFVALNCAALAAPLLEAELFGYESGSFTGGLPGGKEGLLSAADGGSLLLDEIGEMAAELQAKLLRVLQERTYRRVGGNRDLAIDLRIIASTNRDLAAMVDDGSFREDLFYRLNVLSIEVPPLRTRGEDIPELAAHFLDIYSREFGHGDGQTHLSELALEHLVRHNWPGNIRELRNAMERAALLSPGSAVLPEHLGLSPTGPPAATTAPGSDARLLPVTDLSMRSMEEALIRRVLEETDGNRSRAARLLGINRTTLYSKLRSYEIA
jgi:DNA-binding NtrC family response regulator